MHSPEFQIAPDPPHQCGDVSTPAGESLLAEQASHHPTACKRILKVQLIDAAHQSETGFAHRPWPVVDAPAADAHCLCLAGDCGLPRLTNPVGSSSLARYTLSRSFLPSKVNSSPWKLTTKRHAVKSASLIENSSRQEPIKLGAIAKIPPLESWNRSGPCHQSGNLGCPVR